MNAKNKITTSLVFLSLNLGILNAAHSDVSKRDTAPQGQGLVFKCSPEAIQNIQADMEKYLTQVGVTEDLYEVSVREGGTFLNYRIKKSEADGNTLNLSRRESLNIQDEVYHLDTAKGEIREVKTVSKKEIVLAVFQVGRTTMMAGSACDTDSFRDFVGIRQNMVAWVQGINWDFPNDSSEQKFNPELWYKDEKTGFQPRSGKVYQALHDTFINDRTYAMACYDSTILSITHGILDYYYRVKKDHKKFEAVLKDLNYDSKPIAHMIPGKLWSNLPGYNPADDNVRDKILTFAHDVASHNFIPGDWIYVKNVDYVSSEKYGYEGSNALYLGRNYFNDYYNETPNRRFTFEQKINEVYQWRHGVFTSSDKKKAVAISQDEFQKLLKTPEQGGLLRSHRMFYKNY